ncbi:LssY C-terminal domain-containing protein [Candidatus Peregrinibacteria bacterium]|nr:LssY C-terminal domain-containing protein [Candidatus Peregrinibacteria bacterium]
MKNVTKQINKLLLSKIAPRTKFHFVTLFIVALLLIGNTIWVRESDVFGIPFIFAMAFLVEFLLIIFVIHEVLQVLRTPLKILKSLIISSWHGVKQNHYYISAKNKNPAFFIWLNNRFSKRIPTGLKLTMFIAIALLFLFLFLGIAEDVIFKNQIVGIDHRILNLLPSIRTTEQNLFFSFVTFLGNWQSIVLAVILTILLLLRKKQIFSGILFCSTVLFTEGLAFILKIGIGRSRPEQVFSLINADSFSFPSGHAILATVTYGFITYLLIKSFRHSLSKILIFLGYIFSVTLIALSRIYLGVHYLSDVLASITLGFFILSISIGFAEINHRYRIFEQNKKVKFRILFLVPIFVTVFSLTSNSYFIKLKEPQVKAQKLTVIGIDEAAKKSPQYSETLTGAHMEPINFIYVGDEKSIENLFAEHGWYKADAPTFSNILKTFSVIFKNDQYLNAPVTPSYFDSKPHDISFQLPTDHNTLRERHHTRLWKTDYVSEDGRNIWVATASLDTGVELTPYYLPTHHIDPNIDAERDFIVKSLGLSNPKYIQEVAPQIGKNGAGDEFFTDGKAVIIDLTK